MKHITRSISYRRCLSMRIGDIDFSAPKAVNEVIIERTNHGIYGYTMIDDVKDAIVQRRYC